MAAGPPDIDQRARIVAKDVSGRVTQLRDGHNGFTCMPASGPTSPAMCADSVSVQWFADIAAHKPKPTTTVPGITYMLAGAAQRSDADPYDTTSPLISIGPHTMILWPVDPAATGLPRTHREVGAYVMWAGTPYAHVHIMSAPQPAAQVARAGAHPTDDEKIVDALRAGPDFITRDATVLDWPSVPGGPYRVLRHGASAWTCLPGRPGSPHGEPDCLDPTFLTWMQETVAGRTPHVDRVGIAYMDVGEFVPNKAGKSVTPNAEFHVGPHLMIITPHQDELAAFGRDGSTGMPYINHIGNGDQYYLVLPFQRADQQ
jgi:hypothetical protein